MKKGFKSKETKKKNSIYSTGSQEISLLKCNFNLLSSLPRTFKITTNNSSGEFNTDILSITSSEISDLLKKDRNNLQYHLNIEDNVNVLKKFELLYQGETIKFNIDELMVSRQITNQLQISSFPKLSKYNLTSEHSNSRPKNIFYNDRLGIKIDQIFLINNVYNRQLLCNIKQPFTIQTKKREYKCVYNCVFSSLIIKELISKDSKVDRYFYDYEDENDEFQFICDLFNFEEIKLTKDNVDSIKQISEDLKIECIYDAVNTFISKDEKVSQSIDDQQDLIDTNDEIFNLLYNLKSKPIEYSSNLILNSKWSKTEEAVYELAALILQVARTDFKSHEYLVELLIKLDEYESMKLKKLLPFIVNNLMFFCIDNNYSFIYKLYKRGKIPLKLINKSINKACNINPLQSNESSKNYFFYSWFLPESIDLYPDFVSRFDPSKLYYPCNLSKIEEYKKMRDNGECDDEISKTLRNDDVDRFQSFFSNIDDIIKNGFIKANMFEPFFINKISYFNYAAAYGSIKCFKYMLLNDAKIDDDTFKLSIIGGNIEIIRIVFNERKMDMKKKSSLLLLVNALSQSIKMHRNNIFDWILEHNIKFLNDSLLSLIECSIENGNMHSLVQIIDNGFNFHNLSKFKYSSFITIACRNGFYSLLNFIINLIKDNFQIDQINYIDSPNFSVYFGNIFICKIFEERLILDDLKDYILFASKAGYFEIVKYLFEVLSKKQFTLRSFDVNKILRNCFNNDSIEILNYVIDKVVKIDYKIILNSFTELIISACRYDNLELVKKIAEICHKFDPKLDFTVACQMAIKSKLNDVIKYYFKMGYKMDFNELARTVYSYGTIDTEVFSFIMNKIDSELQNYMLRCINNAILAKNKPLVKYLLKDHVTLTYSLIDAASVDDFELVEMILETKCDPSFINQNSEKGTALFISVEKNNSQIFNKLLSIKGIDPSIYNKDFKTPLVLAALEFKFDMFNSILNFYGENIKQQKWQLEIAIKFIFDKNKNNSNFDVELLVPISTVLIKIIELNCIDINSRFYNYTFLTYACENDLIDVVKTLLQNDSIDVNLYDPMTGDTPLMISIKNGNIEISKLLIEYQKTNLYLKNYSRKSAFSLAAIHQQAEIVKFFLQYKNFEPQENEINEIFCETNTEIAKLLLAADSLDLNYIPYKDCLDLKIFCNKDCLETLLMKSIRVYGSELFDLLVQHPSFCKTDKNHYMKLIYVIIKSNNIELFDKLFDLFEKKYKDVDINSHIFNNDSLLVYSISNNATQEFITAVLNYKNFDSRKSDIKKAFELCCSNNLIHFSVNKMHILFDYDEEHEQLIVNEIKEAGKDFSKLIPLKGELMNFIIMNSFFDPNQPNEDGVYPLEYAIKNELNDLTISLIKSNKIDLTRHIETKDGESKYTTYIHLLARAKKIKIPENGYFVLQNLINMTNYLGETPLMEACRYDNKEFINYIFNVVNLDYQHKNNEGEDAIDILRKIRCPNENLDAQKKPNEKYKYLEELQRLFSINQQNKTNSKILFQFGEKKNESEKQKQTAGSLFKPKARDTESNSNQSPQKQKELPKYTFNLNLQDKDNAEKTNDDRSSQSQKELPKYTFNLNKQDESSEQPKFKFNPSKQDKINLEQNSNNQSPQKQKELPKYTFNLNLQDKDNAEKTNDDRSSQKQKELPKHTFNLNKQDENSELPKSTSNLSKQGKSQVNSSEFSDNRQEQANISFSFAKADKTKLQQNEAHHSQEEPLDSNGPNRFSHKESSTSPLDFPPKTFVSHHTQTESAILIDQDKTEKVSQSSTLSSSKPQFNHLNKSVQVESAAADFSKTHEPFSEKPNPIKIGEFNKQTYRNKSELVDDDSYGLFGKKRRERENMGVDEDEPLYYGPQFVDQNQLAILQQQQQQWLQMIEMNNRYQYQINMQLMNQSQMMIANSQHKKKRKRNNGHK